LMDLDDDDDDDEEFRASRRLPATCGEGGWGTSTSSSSAAAAAAAHLAKAALPEPEPTVWEVDLGAGSWTLFDGEAQSAIRSAEAAGHGKLELRARGQVYEIDLVSKTQVNLKTRVQRAIRCIAVPGRYSAASSSAAPPSSSPPAAAAAAAALAPAKEALDNGAAAAAAGGGGGPATAAASGSRGEGRASSNGAAEVPENKPVWEVKLDEGWKKYDPEIVALLEAATDSGRTKVEYKARGQTYEIDFLSAVQVNVKTGVRRAIRRTLPRGTWGFLESQAAPVRGAGTGAGGGTTSASYGSSLRGYPSPPPASIPVSKPAVPAAVPPTPATMPVPAAAPAPAPAALPQGSAASQRPSSGGVSFFDRLKELDD